MLISLTWGIIGASKDAEMKTRREAIGGDNQEGLVGTLSGTFIYKVIPKAVGIH